MIKFLKKTNEFKEGGFGLVEVVLALGISVVVVTSLLSLTLFSLRTSLTSSLLLEATKAGNIQTELLRAYRDSEVSWEIFSAQLQACTAYYPCHMDESLILQTGPAVINYSNTPISTGFYATPDSDDTIIHVVIRSAWPMGGQTDETFVYTDFTNWQNK